MTQPVPSFICIDNVCYYWWPCGSSFLPDVNMTLCVSEDSHVHDVDSAEIQKR